MRKLILNNNNALSYGGNAIILDDGVPDGYRHLTGVQFDGGEWYESNLYLQGSDTLKFAFEASISCNVLGCYTTTNAQTNYSLYAVTTSGSYLRYNGGTYNSYVVANTRYDVTITPTGSQGLPTDSTWTAQTFTAESKMGIGTTSLGATSAKLTGKLYGDIEVVGKEIFMPVERLSDNKILYWASVGNYFMENLGSGTPVALGYVI